MAKSRADRIADAHIARWAAQAAGEPYDYELEALWILGDDDDDEPISETALRGLIETTDDDPKPDPPRRRSSLPKRLKL
jgi:hypothetical protein